MLNFSLWRQRVSDRAAHHRVWVLAFPMILSSLTVPLLGIVDTAVVGHLASAHYMGAVAIGSLIFNFLFWGFGFLRMSATGLTAQAFGQNDEHAIRTILWRSLLLAAILAFILLLLSPILLSIALHWLQASAQVEPLAAEYFHIRAWAVPAILMRFVIMGWLLGLHNARGTLWILLLVNGLNALLDIIFVVYWHYDVVGVAWASTIADYAGLLLAFYLARKQLQLYKINNAPKVSWITLFNGREIWQLWKLNQDIFIRTLLVISAFSFFTAQSATFGDTTLAANTVLLNLVLLLAFALDGFAHAAEALIGRAIGRKDRLQFKTDVWITGLWSVVSGVLFTLLFCLSGHTLIRWMTSITAVQQVADEYLIWLIISPLISIWAFWLDGIFIGATRVVILRNSMIVAIVIYSSVWYLTTAWANHGLWLALLSFLGARGLVLALSYHWIERREGFIVG
ncbi:MAG: MATE family efflux transporter [Gammaproteobacteria bacterium]|nr:MATE family efflux transporter [Gammaproteobacteria bacterium]